MEVLILVVIVVLAVVGVGWYLANWFEEQRTKEYAAVAQKLGLEFFPQGEAGLLESLAEFSLFQLGRGRKLKHLIRGITQNMDLAVFEYRYTIGSGHSQTAQTARQTVVRFESAWLELPKFDLRPAHFGHKIAKLFGYQDITISEFPMFSQKYLLRGKNEEAIRALFSQDVTRHLERLKGLNISGRGSRLIFYRPGERLRGYELQGFLEESFAVYAEFKTANRSEVS